MPEIQFKAPNQRSGSLLNFNNAKTPKGQDIGYATAIVYLSPANESGTKSLCPYASKGCTAACLYTAGYARVYKTVNEARLKRTRKFLDNYAEFMLQLEREIAKFADSAFRQGFIPVVRLNGTSDVMWERKGFVAADGQWYTSMMARMPGIQFYDYTKIPYRFRKNLPANYDLTFSLSEDNDSEAQQVLDNGGRVAVVFKQRPETFMGVVTVNGDASDARFDDPANSVVSLTAKGEAKQDTSGFVR